MYKQVIVVRSDLKMSKGKTAAQCAHAAVSAIDNADKKSFAAWKKSGQKKIVVRAKSEQHLYELKARCDNLKLACSLIIDAGMTELSPGTATVLGIGPAAEKKIDKVTGSLPLLK